MNHHEIVRKFQELFEIADEEIKVWFQNGKNSIRVRDLEQKEFIFTYENDNNWCLESQGHFLNRLKGEKRND